MLSLPTKIFRFFILDFGIVAFNTTIDFLLAELCLVNRDFSFSTYLLVPNILFHYWGIDGWNYWTGALFLLTGLARFLGVMFRFKTVLTLSAGLSFFIWLVLVNFFLFYSSVFGVFPVAEVHFSVVMAYGNMMLFLRYCIGYTRLQGRKTTEDIIY